MRSFYAFCMLLATGLTVGEAAPRNHGRGDVQTFAAGSSYFGSNQQGGANYNGAVIRVIQNRGKTEIYINGQRVDVNRATVLEDNDHYRVLEPEGIPGARITIKKENGQIGVEYAGAQYLSMPPEMVSAQLSQSMQETQEELNRMRENLSKIFNGFPFGGPGPNF